MTDGTGVVCRRCGFANVAGDQFCGSCGAFLEWEGEVSGAPAPPATSSSAGSPPAGIPGSGSPSAGVPGADDDLAGLVRPAGAPTPAAAGPAPMTFAPSATPTPLPIAQAAAAQAAGPTSGGSAAGLLRCPACGIANASTRTFCQSCGTRLAEASRVTEVSREQIAAAVSARPASVPPTQVRKTARDEPSGGSSGGIAGWIIGVAVLGIVVGVAFVAASILFKGSGPASGATAAPSVVTSAGPGAGGAAASPGTGASGAPSTAAAASPDSTQKTPGVPLKLTGATASSVVGDLAKFQPGMAIDGNVKTSWQEGSRDEKGQWIEVTFDPARVDAVVLNNGYGASTALYKGNLRLKKVQVSVDGATPKEVTLKDTGKDQLVVLGEHPGATRVRITILSTYPSTRTAVAGTPFDDAALSEIGVLGVAGG